MDRLASLLLLLALGCRAPSTTPATSAEPIVPTTEPAAPRSSPEPAATPVAAATPTAAPSVATTPVAAATPTAETSMATTPAQPLQPSSAWPFHVWDRAEAIQFNHVRYGPGVALRAYDAENGWSPKIVERRAISRAQAEQAVKWTISTGGEVEVSKCAFPRHAVVLYSGETPVGSVNVCFECGDILVWPDIDRAPDRADMSAAAEKQLERRYQKKLQAYKKVFPRWEQLFRDELGWPLEPAGAGG